MARRTDKGRFADGTLKVVADMSAEERYIARSRQIRKKLASWLAQNVGAEYASMGELHRDAANYAGCSMTTASRWVYQYTGPGQPFVILPSAEEDRYTLALRGDTLPTWDTEKAKEKKHNPEMSA